MTSCDSPINVSNAKKPLFTRKKGKTKNIGEKTGEMTFFNLFYERN